MNSLPLMTDIIRPGELSTIVFFEVRPVADFMNTMYWHDTLDKSLISQGSVKISRVYHCTYAGFIKRNDTNELSVMHYDGTFVAHDQIVTVVDFVAQIGKEKTVDGTVVPASVWLGFVADPKPATRPEPENIDDKKLTVNCKSCAMPTAFVKEHRALIPIGISDIVVPRECRECGSTFVNWIPK